MSTRWPGTWVGAWPGDWQGAGEASGGYANMGAIIAANGALIGTLHANEVQPPDMGAGDAGRRRKRYEVEWNGVVYAFATAAEALAFLEACHRVVPGVELPHAPKPVVVKRRKVVAKPVSDDEDEDELMMMGFF